MRNRTDIRTAVVVVVVVSKRVGPSLTRLLYLQLQC